MRIGIFVWFLSIWFLIGCSKEETTERVELVTGYSLGLSLEGVGYIDSAQVFFFRKRLTRDTLIRREVIRGIDQVPRAFTFYLPAGYYDVVTFGNVATERIVASPPYSPDDIILDYSKGENPPMIYYGRIYVDVGRDKAGVSGMVPVTARVELTIKEIPNGVDSIRVDLYNTGAGTTVNTYPLDEITHPNLVKTLRGIVAGQTYTVAFACFVPVEKYGKSSLGVSCYNRKGQLVFQGESAPFHIISRMLISCSFRDSTGTTRSGRERGGKNIMLKWELNEDNL